MSYSEFEAGAILEALSRNDPMKLFEAMDQDGNHTVDRHEFMRAVRSTKGCDAVSGSSIELVFDALDQDGSGELSWAELRAKLQPDEVASASTRLRKLSAGRKSKSLGSTARLVVDEGAGKIGVVMQLAAMLQKNLSRVIDLVRFPPI